MPHELLKEDQRLSVDYETIKGFQKHIIKAKIDFYKVDELYGISQETFGMIVGAKSDIVIPANEVQGFMLILLETMNTNLGKGDSNDPE